MDLLDPYTDEMFTVYSTLLEAYEHVSTDTHLESFIEDATRQLREFEESYPEIVSEYKFMVSGY